MTKKLGDIRLSRIVMDSEAAVWSAVKVVYPQLDVFGCSFHWAQAVMRKLANLGLRTSYCEKKGLYYYVQQLLALPFLPPGHIELEFGSMANQVPCPQLRPLIEYLENTWITNPNWSIRQWSIYRQSIRTNNDCQGWHRRFNGKAERAMLHFYLLVLLLRKESNMVKVTVCLVEEQTVSRYCRLRFRILEEKTQSLWDKLEAQNIRTSAFLRAMSRPYSPGFQ